MTNAAAAVAGAAGRGLVSLHGIACRRPASGGCRLAHDRAPRPLHSSGRRRATRTGCRTSSRSTARTCGSSKVRPSAGRARAAPSTATGKKHPFFDSQGGSWGIDDVHPAAWDPARSADADGRGRHRHPGASTRTRSGSAGRTSSTTSKDRTLLRLCVEIYNDAMAEMQEQSGNRLLPMPIMPAWDIDECVREAQRCAAHGLSGREHDGRSAGLRIARSRRPGVGSVLGSVRRPGPSGALPHRCQPDVAGLLRHHLLAEPGRLRQARHRRRVAVPEQLADAHQQRVLRACSTGTRT